MKHVCPMLLSPLRPRGTCCGASTSRYPSARAGTSAAFGKLPFSAGGCPLGRRPRRFASCSARSAAGSGAGTAPPE